MTGSSDKIFVQIPAYRDSQLVPTIDSLLNNAQNNERLQVWICWQHSANETLPKALRSKNNINVIDVDYKQSRGVGWARAMIQQQWSKEP